MSKTDTTERSRADAFGLFAMIFGFVVLLFAAYGADHVDRLCK